MVGLSLTSNSLSENNLGTNGTATNGLSTNGTGQNGAPSTGEAGNGQMPLVACPGGYYFDQGLQGCASLGAAETQCPDGYEFAPGNLGCQAKTPEANYPGCPAGQLLDPATGQCDANSRLISPTSRMVFAPVQVTLPDCSNAGGSSGPGAPGGGSVCPAGYTFTCDPVCGCAPP